MPNQLIILQPINLCNLNCSYCYVPGRRDPAKMSEDILEASIKHVFNSPKTVYDDTLTFLWHAGEPLAAGIEYYQKSVNYIKKYNTDNRRINFAIQTNATLINQAWCDFFKKHHFDVGISVDGPKFIHDNQRRDWLNHGSFDRVMKGVELLKTNGIELASISVITDYTLDHVEEFYQFFKENKFVRLAINIDENESIHTTSSFNNLSPELINRYKNFMSKLYDLWIQDHRSIKIREFEDMLSFIVFKKSSDENVIAMDATAFSIITISKTGDINTFSPEMAGGTAANSKEFIIGNVLEINSFDDLIENPNFRKQLTSIGKGINNCANVCEYFELCGGGSPTNKYYETGSFEATETMHCKLTKQALTDVVLDKISVC